MEIFNIAKKVNNECQFVLEADNKHVILISLGNTSKAICNSCITSVRSSVSYNIR